MVSYLFCYRRVELIGFRWTIQLVLADIRHHKSDYELPTYEFCQVWGSALINQRSVLMTTCSLFR
jgi:hypothetical protein